MKRYLVIGAGVAGCTAAGELVRSGHTVTLLESTGMPGGKVLSYACKATQSCSRCGVCVAHERISEALLDPRITLLPGARIEGVSEAGGRFTLRGSSSHPRFRFRDCTDCGACAAACPGKAISRYSRAGLSFMAVDYGACVLHAGQGCCACAKACPTGAIELGARPRRRFTLQADGVLLATGHETFLPTAKPRLGYGQLPGVMTGLEAEQTLSRQTWLPACGNPSRPARSVAFVQCVGSRDPSLKRNFCSAVCCAYALRMARLLKSLNPDMTISVYHIDIQNFDKVFTPLRQELEQMGIRFLRAVPSSVASGPGGMLRLSIEDPAGRHASMEHDAVVLSTGIAPGPDAPRLADLLGLRRDEFGFLRSIRPGVGTAGTCAEPRGILESISSARAAALEMAG